MAKKNSQSNANDTATSSPAQPKTDRRMTSREPAPVNVEPGASHVAQDRSPATQAKYESTSPEPSEHEIRLRAYHRYLDRGAFDGADFDDWLQAEMELKKR